MILETGNHEDFKHCVLDNVAAWRYQCDHVRVLDLDTMERHGGRAVDFGLCEECKDEESRQLLKFHVLKNRARRDGDAAGVQAVYTFRAQFEGMFPLSEKLHGAERDLE